ncbi:hypothetical protein PTKIN_Ptkin09bG0171400 [Pterospermum kingtungense]
MGSCISKCKPKKYYIEDFSHVQDKLVISSSQTPKTPIPVSNRISPLPLSPTISSSSSVSSFTCTTSSSTTSSCSSLSSSASVLSSKDRSFSNEFLWACVKENPHIIRINSIKEASRALSTTKSPNQRFESPVKPSVASVKQAIQAVDKGSTPKKRGRSSSPSTLTRQKSFRKEPDRLNSAYHLPTRTLRSPSPSRRFSGDNSTRGILASTSKEICSSKRIVGPKVNALNSVSSSLRKENLIRPSSSPMLNSNPSPPLKSCLRNRKTFIHRISSKLDENALRAALAQQENDSITMEDIDNPLISLDCFIFL